MQALMLAAGMGRRMGKYTESYTKCMVSVAGKTLLERAIESIKDAGIDKLVMVIGYEAESLRKYVEERDFGIRIEYVYNYDYASTNNIYSLYLAKDYLQKDDTILLESDLIFDRHIIKDLVRAPQQNLVVAAKYEHWMDGTVVVLDKKKHILDFVDKASFCYEDVDKYYKTVNIYKFSKSFSANQYLPFLEAYIKAYGMNQYYEQVLNIFAHIQNSQMSAYVLGDENWYEIDDAQDLDIASTIFAKDSQILKKYELHFGGYWRFPKVKDFCYLVNPYYPPRKMVDQLQYFFWELLTQYPSGMNIQKMNAASMFGVDGDYLLVGNGAAELINVLGKVLKGRLSVCIPTFNEYVRCFTECEIRRIDSAEHGYQYDLEQLLEEADRTDHLLLINPDNPSGAFLSREDVLCLLEKCESKGVSLILDESFIDFAQKDVRYTLIDEAILREYPHLIVLKSIGKSYGIPGLRLGVMATGDQELQKIVRQNMAIWNINSFAEYYLQIQRLYKKSYVAACDQIALQREWMQEQLSRIEGVHAYPSQANYIMCSLDGRMTSAKLAMLLIRDHGILIKNLSGKEGFKGESFFRVAVKNREDNQLLIDAMREVLQADKGE